MTRRVLTGWGLTAPTGADVVAPLANSLGPGGRLIGIHSCGHDPGAEIVREVWPDDKEQRRSHNGHSPP